MNGGRCKVMDPSQYEIRRHPGCECPTGWSGLNCEYPESETLKAKFHYGEQNQDTVQGDISDADNRNFFKTVAWICLLIVLAMVGGIGFAVWDGYRETNRTRRRRLEKATKIPTQISAKIKSKTKRGGLQPMEIEEF